MAGSKGGTYMTKAGKKCALYAHEYDPMEPPLSEAQIAEAAGPDMVQSFCGSQQLAL